MNLHHPTLPHAARLALPPWALAVIPALALLPAHAQLFALDERGGFDDYHNVATGEGFSDFRTLLADDGFSLTPRHTFTAPDLMGVAALILLQPYSAAAAYTPAELSAIQAFVAGGGGLLVLGDAGTGSSAAFLNTLTAGFGVTYDASPSDALGATIEGFTSHPLTEDLTQVSIDYQRPLTISPPGIDLTLDGGSANILAVSGHAVFVSDSSVFMNPDAFSNASLASTDNRPLAHNVGHFLAAVPEPPSVLPAGLALLAFAGWRYFRRST